MSERFLSSASLLFLSVIPLMSGACRDDKDGRAKKKVEVPVTSGAAATDAAPVAGADAGAAETAAALRTTARDCNASTWSSPTSRPMDAKRLALLDRAGAAVEADEQRYEFHERKPTLRDPNKVVCWKESGPRSLFTLDRLDRQPVHFLQCSFGGETFAVGELDGAADSKNSDKPPGSCYAACGAGCKGICKDVPVGCAPPAAGATSSPAFACITLVESPDSLPRYPWLRTDEGPRCVDPKRHANPKAEACTETVNRFAPDGLVATTGQVRLCSAAECCGHHDECTGAHTKPWQAAFWKCHWYGERKCGGPWAIVGRPDNTNWTIRVYNTKGQPVTGREEWKGKPIEVGECSWANGKPTWKPPAAQMESYTCAVDGIEH